MGEWKKLKIKDFGKIITGYTPKTSDIKNWDGEIPFYTPSDINGSQYCKITQRKVSENALQKERILEKDSIMITCIASIGKMALAYERGISNQQINSINIYDVYSPQYLYYLLSYNVNEILKIAGSTAVPIVNKNQFENIEVFTSINKTEQTRIAEILSTADEAIAHTEALIAKYQRIKTGLMQDLLTKGIDENGNIRSKATHKFMVKNGIEVPEEWEVDSLGTLIKAIDAHPSHRTPPSIENGAPYLGISDIDDEGNIDLKKCRKVSYSVLAEHNNRYQLRDGDIIFGKIGTIGEPKRLKAWNNVTISANVILIQPHNTSDFIFWVLNSEYINNQVKNTIHSTSQPAFGMEKVRALTILIPQKKERETIQNILNQNEFNIISTKRHLSKLQSLKTGLMQDLLSGKVRVKI